MDYKVLARKWRPKSFTHILGQEHVTRALKNALDNDRLHHAYLFSGTRGIGKTTIARIFAKCVNCIGGVTSNPCGQCVACQEIDAGHFIDLIEIDAASRTKVEDTRELLNNVQYAPTYGRYKIYLIDEVHMLSGHSFNALLKTLEEPPTHVKFLLATTDPQKLPVTILSRCLQFNLKIIPPEKITDHLVNILQTEQISFELPALQRLTHAAKGSARDALSLLDQAIAYGNHNVTLTDVNAMLGSVENAHLFAILTALAKHDAPTVFATIAYLNEQAADFSDVLEDLLTLLHNIALMQTVPNLIHNDYDVEQLKQLEQLATLLTPEEVQLFYQIALIGHRDLPFSPSPKSGFEMVMLRMLAFYPDNLSLPTFATESKDSSTSACNKSALHIKSANIKPETSPETLQDIPTLTTENWSDILSKLNVSPPTKAFAANCTIGTISNDQVELLLHSKHAPLLNKNHEDRLKEAFCELFRRPIKVRISLINAMACDTPQDLTKKDFDRKQKMAEDVIRNNNTIQAMLKTFNATIIPQSIKQQEEVK